MILKNFLFSVIVFSSFCTYSAEGDDVELDSGGECSGEVIIVENSLRQNVTTELANLGFNYGLNPKAQKLMDAIVDHGMLGYRLSYRPDGTPMDEEMQPAKRKELTELLDVPLALSSLRMKLEAILMQKFALKPLPTEGALFNSFKNPATRAATIKNWLSEDQAWQSFKEHCLGHLGLDSFIIIDIMKDFHDIISDLLVNNSLSPNKYHINFILYVVAFLAFRIIEKFYFHNVPLVPTAMLISSGMGLHEACCQIVPDGEFEWDAPLGTSCNFKKVFYICVMLASIFALELHSDIDIPLVFMGIVLFGVVIGYNKFMILNSNFNTRKFLGESVEFAGISIKSTLSLIVILTKMFLSKDQIYNDCVAVGGRYIDSTIELGQEVENQVVGAGDRVAEVGMPGGDRVPEYAESSGEEEEF